MSIGKKIKAARQAKAWTQRRLADDLSVSVQAVSQWESDRTLPNIARIMAIADILSVDLEWIMGETPLESYKLPPSPMKKTFDTSTPIIRLEDSHLFMISLLQSDRDAPEVNGEISRTFPNYRRTFAVYVEKDMAKSDFLEGDLLIFEARNNPNLGDFVVFFDIVLARKAEFHLGQVDLNRSGPDDEPMWRLKALDKTQRAISGPEPEAWLALMVTGVLVEMRRFHGNKLATDY